MLGILYIVTNNINNKKYVGKTYLPLNVRIRNHIADRNKFKHRPLYRAFNKYGIENFSFEEVGAYDQGILEAEEVLLIKLLDTYNNGYNATLGGDGKRYIDVEDSDVIDTYNKLLSIKETSEIYKVHRDTISKILKNNNIKILSGAKVTRNKSLKPIEVQPLNLIFKNVDEVVNFLIQEGKTSAMPKTIKEHIRKVITGSKSTYLGLEFIGR